MSVGAEIMFSLYAGISALIALKEEVSIFPFLLLYAIGMLTVAGMSLWQGYSYREIVEEPPIALQPASSQS